MKLLKTKLSFAFTVLFMMSGFFQQGCSSKQAADLINSAANARVVVGAYSGFIRAFLQAQSVHWTTVSSRLWEAQFSQNQIAMAAWLKYDGTVIDQGRVIAAADLPTVLLSSLVSYSGQPVGTIITNQEGSSNPSYRILMEKSGHWHLLRLNAYGQT